MFFALPDQYANLAYAPFASTWKNPRRSMTFQKQNWNYSPYQAQCYVALPFADLSGSQWRLRELIGDAVYERDGNDLQTSGLYLDEPGWKASVFRAKSMQLKLFVDEMLSKLTVSD